MDRARALGILAVIALLTGGSRLIADDTSQKEVTTTKDGNTVTRHGTVTGPNGKTTSSSAGWTKDGNTVTRDGSTTGPNGGTVSSHGTWTKDGNTITHEGTTTKQGAAAKKKPRARVPRPRAHS